MVPWSQRPGSRLARGSWSPRSFRGEEGDDEPHPDHRLALAIVLATLAVTARAQPPCAPDAKRFCAGKAAGKAGALAGGPPMDAAIGKEHLAEIFGIEMEGAGQAATAKTAKRPRRAAKKPARRRARVGGGTAGVGSFTSVRRR